MLGAFLMCIARAAARLATIRIPAFSPGQANCSDGSGYTSSFGSIVGGALSLFGKRGLGGSIRADSKRAMTQERNNVIAPYENLKLIIDNYIHSIDNAKKEIDDFIIELKSQEQLEKPSKANTKNGRF